jgi:hypothetical protein
MLYIKLNVYVVYEIMATQRADRAKHALVGRSTSTNSANNNLSVISFAIFQKMASL